MNLAGTLHRDDDTGLYHLLDAAESQFSAHGFDGAGMKAIARQAQVSQSLLHYHFGTKEALYRAVIERRATAINAERHRLLDAVDLSASDAVARVFDALLRPPVGPVGGGMSYARIFAGLAAGGERDSALVREFYDGTARRFIRALQQAAPGASRLTAARAYTMAIGLLVTSLPGEDRAARLADAPPSDHAAPPDRVADLVAFACGGYAALLTQKHKAGTDRHIREEEHEEHSGPVDHPGSDTGDRPVDAGGG